MGLLDDLKPAAKVWPCKVRATVARLEADDAKILLAAVEGEDWAIKSLSTALQQKGIALSYTPIKAHRDKSCSCWKN